MDIIPSIYDTRNVMELEKFEAGGHFDNKMLRVGEVKRIIYPEDKANRTGRFIEYDVFVQHRENGTAVTKMYHNCWLANALGGLADYDFRTLRVNEARSGEMATGPAPDVAKTAELGFGSKVLILCINGSHSEAIIISGIRDQRQDDKGRKAKGVHMDWEFNGVHVNVADDGSFSVEYKGPTKADGKTDTSKVAAASTGTKISVSNDGSFTVATKDKKQSVVIDNKAGTITVTGDKDLTLNAQTIHIGKDASEKAVLGDTLVKLLGQLIDAIMAQTHPTAVGPSGPPINVAAFAALKPQLMTALSQHITVKKSP